MTSIEGNRQRLLEIPNSQFVEPGEFLDRAISRQSLQRIDDHHAAVHGLLDTQSGVRFYVEDEKLSHWRSVPR